jgi:hypothetical protein
MTFDPPLAAALAALPWLPVPPVDPLHSAFAGRVTGMALVLDETDNAYFAVVRLIPPTPFRTSRRPACRRGRIARRPSAPIAAAPGPQDDAA